MHNSWFKTTSGTYINKTCSYILSGFNDPTTLDHLLEFELKGQFPVFRIENPTPTLHKDFPYLKNRYNLDLWDLCWNSLNLGGLCWLLDKNFPLSHGKVCDIIHQLKNANSQLLALAESEQFKDFILKFTKTIAGQKSFNSPQDQEPISIAYEIASCCPDSVAEALINAYAPECFTDLRLLNSKRLDLALNLYGEKFPLIHNIIKYEKKSFKWPKDNLKGYGEKINQLCSHEKLSEALEKVFGLSSKLFIKAFEPCFMVRQAKSFTLDLKFFKKVSLLAGIFLPKNHSDFLHYLNTDLSKLEKHTPYIQACAGFTRLLSLFNEEQKKTLINNALKKDTPSIAQALDIFGQHETYYRKYFSENDFKEFNDLTKIKDIIFEKEEIACSPFQEMDQTQFFPEAKTLSEIVLPEDYVFVLPKSNHDLIDWGVELDHCVGGEDYQEDTANGDCLIVGVFKGNKVKYTLEVRDGEFVQIQGKSSASPKSLVYTSVVKALELLKIIER